MLASSARPMLLGAGDWAVTVGAVMSSTGTTVAEKADSGLAPTGFTARTANW